MRVLFADTSYLIAIFNEADTHHDAAVALAERIEQGPPFSILTTDAVLSEFLTFVAESGPQTRRLAAQVVRGLLNDPEAEVVVQSRELFLRGLSLYERRLDKGYSLADCLSFEVMRERGLWEALTADDHFEREGFRALLRRQF